MPVSVHSNLSYEFAGFLLDPAEQLLVRQNGKTVPLTPKVCEIRASPLINSGKSSACRPRHTSA